jgi:hypothetical protein
VEKSEATSELEKVFKGSKGFCTAMGFIGYETVCGTI